MKYVLLVKSLRGVSESSTLNSIDVIQVIKSIKVLRMFDDKMKLFSALLTYKVNEHSSILYLVEMRAAESIR